MPDTAVRPAHAWVPAYTRTNGDIAAEFGAQIGLTPDAEQRMVLDAIYAEDDNGLPACFEVCTVAPRQNMKTAALMIAALTDLFVFGDSLHVWTAHLFKTSTSSFEGMVRAIDANDDLRRRCRKPRTANGDEAIELLTGERIEFHARSKGGGRGLTGDKVTLDEGLFLGWQEMGALIPTMATRPRGQVRVGSSAGVIGSEVLRSMRDRGRAGGDASLAYLEWCAPLTDCAEENCTHLPVGRDGCALDRRDLWRQSNPALGRRISEAALERFRRAMSPHEFSREFLGWWDDPALGAAGKIDLAAWSALVDPRSQIAGLPTLSVDVSPDRSRATLAAAGLREDGRGHVEVLKNDAGTGWLVRDLVRAASKAGVMAVHLDATSPAGSLIPDIEAAGLDVIAVSARDLAQACGALVDRVAQDDVRHLGQFDLDSALTGASTRALGDGAWAWSRRSSQVDISPLVAVTIALHGSSSSPFGSVNLW